ncbi:uncharacterized protein LOC126457744 [Schistocerca serialis cubense]|uniref:uncharacterized protein LOC126457744 n=1 Tax=Schistocerca serialis cubense TaxID=2023355 RepID=UPI00214E658B|nr:uncharacterized protein LOC126457744 [Schistocerca serialis cubense]
MAQRRIQVGMREEIGQFLTKNNRDVCLRFAPVAVQRSRGGKATRAAQSRQRGALCSLYSGRRRPDEVEVRQGLVCPVALDPRHRVYGATLLEEGRVGTENTPCSATSKTSPRLDGDGELRFEDGRQGHSNLGSAPGNWYSFLGRTTL